MKNISKKKFYIQSFTYGLPMSIIGAVACVVLMALGHKPKKYGHAYYMEIGEGWGGVELGWFFIVNKGASDFIKRHELGHTYQNACKYGWAMPFVVCIPSCVRYWWRKFMKKIGHPPKTGYYDIWFEKEANEIGNEVMGD